MNALLNKYFKKKFLRECPGFVYFAHGIVPNEVNQSEYSDLHLELEILERNINFWQNYGFQFISYSELEQIILYGEKPEYPWIHLTLDDGYKNNLSVAYPYLKNKNIPFTIYVSVRNVLEQLPFDNHRISLLMRGQRSENEFRRILKKYLTLNIHFKNKKSIIKLAHDRYKYLKPDDKQKFIHELKSNFIDDIDALERGGGFEKPLTPDDLVELSKSDLVNIGSHGYNHNILTTLSEAEIKYEMSESKKVLESIINKEVRTYCYPNGTFKDYNTKIEEICRLSMYYTAFTTINTKWNKRFSHFSLPRIPMSRQPLQRKAVKLLLK